MPDPSGATEGAVLSRQAGDVAVVTLNRPHVLNALNPAMLEGLLTSIEGARAARALVIEGAGRAFCSGEDLRESLAPVTGEAEELRQSLDMLQDITRVLSALPCPSVAAVQGYAVGGGAELALTTDLVIVAPDLRLRFPEVPLGHAPTGGITLRLPQLVGLMRAKEMLLTGRWVDADECLRLGLCIEVTADPRRRALQLAHELAGYPPRSVAAVRRGLELSALPGQEQNLQAEIDSALYCFSSTQARESLERFRQARAQPNGSGRPDPAGDGAGALAPGGSP
jgi:2-(1,2-epoxy-1,2-dihydrophenyl)acetyl-CoA isomerase